MTLDIATVEAFLLVSELSSFTRAAEALGTTQAAVSMKLKRLEGMLGRRLIERSPRAVRLTEAGAAFHARARDLVEAHARAVGNEATALRSLALGISDHAAGGELVPLLTPLRRTLKTLALSVTIGFSRDLLDALDEGRLDAVIVRQEGSRRGGEQLADDHFGWFAAPDFVRHGGALPLAMLAAPCGVRALAVRALDKAGLAWAETFTGGGVPAVVAAAQAGLAIAPLAARIAPPGLIDIGAALRLPRLPRSKVMLHAKVGDADKRAALRLVSASFRGGVAAGHAA
jgi:DNA-binding transcriptional LysR family regulator